MRIRSFLLSLLFVTVSASADPYQWLEENRNDATKTWVAEQNAASLSWLAANPLNGQLEREVTASLTANQSAYYAAISGGKIYKSFSRILKRIDADRPTAPESEWEEFLDVPRIEAEMGTSWKYSSRNCLLPELIRCLLTFTQAGSDKTVVREYDRAVKSFVVDGFDLPFGKNRSAWLDENTILVGVDLGSDTLTTSGYPRQVRSYRRSLPLSEAPIVFEIPRDEVGVSLSQVANSTLGSTVLLGADRTFWSTEIYRTVNTGGIISNFRLKFPAATRSYEVVGDTLLAYIGSDETVDGTLYQGGSFIEVPLVEDAPVSLAYFLDPIQKPFYFMSATSDRLWVSYYEDVHGKLATLRKVGNSYAFESIDIPRFGVVVFADGDAFGSKVMIKHSTLIENDIIYRGQTNAEGASTITKVESLPPQTDPSRLTVEQFKARSSDGTLVPYFLIRRTEDIGKTVPTVLYGYGGFGSVVHADTLNGWFPFYLKSFIPRGGAFVLAGIRGGGEYGEPWHQAGIRMNRWNSFNDFFAVSEDLIAKGVTTPAQLGIRGDSNGGILMGVSLTAKPDLFGAIVIKHGLFDMIRYTQMEDAGSSWIAEFGDPADSTELAYLETYSPYSKIEAGRAYPPILVTTATNDDRVHPAHSRKTHAKLKGLGSESIFYESAVGGHGRSDRAYRILESTMELQFFMEKLGL